MTTFPTMQSDHAASFAYYGSREGWKVALTVHRDSDALERSNWRVIVPPILEAHPETAAVERMNHWAVGWVDTLLVSPSSPAELAMLEWARRLEEYSVADEDDFYGLESSEEWCVRCDRGTAEEHDTLFPCVRFRSAEDAEEIRYRWRHRRYVRMTDPEERP